MTSLVNRSEEELMLLNPHRCPGFGCAWCGYHSLRESNRKLQEYRRSKGEGDGMLQAERSGVERTDYAPDHTSAERSRRHG